VRENPYHKTVIISDVYMTDSENTPWIQRLYDRIWLIALAALVFWFLSYLGWGIADVLTTPGG